MKVRVKLYAAFREALGRDEVELDMPDDATVAQVRRKLVEQFPKFGALGETGLVAINQEFVRGEARVRDGDEVVFLPPVSGGQCV